MSEQLFCSHLQNYNSWFFLERRPVKDLIRVHHSGGNKEHWLNTGRIVFWSFHMFSCTIPKISLVKYHPTSWRKKQRLVKIKLLTQSQVVKLWDQNQSNLMSNPHIFLSSLYEDLSEIIAPLVKTFGLLFLKNVFQRENNLLCIPLSNVNFRNIAYFILLIIQREKTGAVFMIFFSS